MPASQLCAVLFVDISGSIRLYEELGDAQALARVESCLRLLQRAADELRGRVIKTTGDGLMCAFTEAEAALQAALEAALAALMREPATRTRDLDGPLGTRAFGEAVLDQLA
jgi:class 3 adenylate cyclase